MSDLTSSVPIQRIEVSAYTVPTEMPESDGTLEWKSTTMVVVQASAGNRKGLGYTYADTATAELIRQLLAKIVEGRDAMATSANWNLMVRAIRNLGRPGIAAMAVSAIDVALWDLKAQLLDLPLATLLGPVRDAAPVYASGGFTSYSDGQLIKQLRGWAEQGFGRIKMKVGRDAGADRLRVRMVRQALGDRAALFIDANGAYSRKQALAQAEAFREAQVSWFEEPVSSDDLDGLRLLRDRAPSGMDIAAGEYGYDLTYFRRMLEAGAVDVLQADATRCGGITGFLGAARLCEAHQVALSAHTAPALHLHLGCSVLPLCHLEYFHDHVRLERMFFDGVSEPKQGDLRPDWSRPGMGIALKRADMERFAA